MQNHHRIESLLQISKQLHLYLNRNEESYPIFNQELNEVIKKSEGLNAWFTTDFQTYALTYWATHLTHENLQNWLSAYSFPKSTPQKIGLILAGNIPMVGFHDVLCVILSGNIPVIKLSSKDPFLIPFILETWKSIDPTLEFEITEKLENFDQVIATGSNNTARYFDFYFKDKPHIIRRNRTSLAVLNGNETDEELSRLADDIFIYFGLGCRNVTQLFIPEGFDINRIFHASLQYQHLLFHTKYHNSYEYQKAIYLLNKDEFWDNNFLLLRNSEELFAPVATVNYKFYHGLNPVLQYLNEHASDIQSIVSNDSNIPHRIALGTAQQPPLNSYADGMDVMQFLLEH